MHKKKKYLIITLATLIILAGGAIIFMYFTKSVFFAVPKKSTSQPQTGTSSTIKNATADYKTAIPALSDQADADYLKAQSGSSN